MITRKKTFNSKDKISITERKEIMLSIMDEIDLFCKDNNLTYFLVGGSLLGAIRHKGFIPWDDDIDIGMPRKDYETFLKSFVSKSGNVLVEDYRSRDRFIWPSAKAIDKRTILFEVNDKRIESGVYVDIFSFDGVKGEYDSVVKKVKKKLIWKNALTLKYLSINKKRSFFKNMLVVIGKLLYIIPDKFLIKNINYSEKNPIDFIDCNFICNFSGAWGLKEIAKSSNFISTIDADFEGRKYRIPIGFEDYLKTVYGDYMTLPPIEKRISTHSSDVYWR